MSRRDETLSKVWEDAGHHYSLFIRLMMSGNIFSKNEEGAVTGDYVKKASK